MWAKMAIEKEVMRAVQDGALCKLLQTEQSGSTNAAAIEAEMRRLHPEGPPVAMDYAPGTLEFSLNSVEAAVKSFPCGSSGGISGWRASHFKAMLRSEERVGLLNALTNFTNAIANGQFSAECMKVITAARLVAVPKPLGGIRPIAVGDFFRRLAGKCLLKSAQEPIVSYLSPSQVGVQVPNAAEKVPRKVRAWTGRAKQDEVIPQVDFKNAFGSVFREEMLKEVKARCPIMLPYATGC